MRALRHPVCDIHVVKALFEAWDRSRSRRADSHNDQNRPRQISIVPPLTCRELPRRLFRSPPLPSTPIPPLVIYIFDTFGQSSDPTYHPSPNSHKGYPLCRAVLQSNYELASYLLQKGADPSLKDYMAVEIAISVKDLKMVKLLVEREQNGSGITRIESKSESPAKKIKLGDRIIVPAKMVESAMKKGAKDIVNYLVYDKSESSVLRSSLLSPVTHVHLQRLFLHCLPSWTWVKQMPNQKPKPNNSSPSRKRGKPVLSRVVLRKAVAIYNYFMF